MIPFCRARNLAGIKLRITQRQVVNASWLSEPGTNLRPNILPERGYRNRLYLEVAVKAFRRVVFAAFAGELMNERG